MTTTTRKLVRLGQAQHMGKWEPATAMVRLVRDLAQRLEELGELSADEMTQIGDVIYPFLATLPQKVSEEVRHG